MVHRSLLLVFFSLISFGLLAESGIKNDTVKVNKPVRTYNTVRITEKPIIDGVLNDACWEKGEWASDFTQWVPNEGARASQRTELKVLYDEKNIYVAIRAFDTEPEKIHRKAASRDDLAGDVVGICFDSYHDYRTGFEFDVTAAGQKIDGILTNPWNGDFSWNAVWYVKVGMEDSAWTAEFEIPLSQLRYSSDDVQVWGIHCWRWIDRLQEESDWEVQSSTSPGMLYLFGNLKGIVGLQKSRHIEFMPYAVSKVKTYEKEILNPYANKGRTFFGNAGLDAKIGITSNFTVDFTVNPDFGQVEADPSEMNITAFESYFDEKRPFFLEGKNIFNYQFDDLNLFYSRRIGQKPSYQPDSILKYPDFTSIISAEKFSGKTAKGLSIGVIHSITASEKAIIKPENTEEDVVVEPLTNYFVARVQQDINKSNTVIGGMLTSTNRFIHNSQLDYMNKAAYTGGVDLLHQWRDKEYFVDAKFLGSYIDGDKQAIQELQRSSAHYFQRPDADYITYDSTLTNLSGFGGRIKVGKGSKGLWRYATEINWRAPGLDLNDIGFMQMADLIKQENSLSYFVNKPVSIFRTYSLSLGEYNSWDFGMNHLYSSGEFDVYLEFLNKWAFSTGVSYKSQEQDNTLLRGGSSMITPASYSVYANIHTDWSKKISFSLNSNMLRGDNQRYNTYSISPGISVQPVTSLKLSMNARYTHSQDALQYVKLVSDRYILGKINNKTLGITFKANLIITPELSLQYYGSPFASIGRFSQFKQVTNPHDKNYNNRFKLLNPVADGSVYKVDENNDGAFDYSFDNPDFDFYQFRSNFVFRWEYRPGSQIYLVWSNERTNEINPGLYSLENTTGRLRAVFPTNVFLIKFNYWFSL